MRRVIMKIACPPSSGSRPKPPKRPSCFSSRTARFANLPLCVSPPSEQQNAGTFCQPSLCKQHCKPESRKAVLTAQAGHVSQDYIDSFDCGLQESHVVVMGRLSVFRWHLGFHSSGPFDYVRTLIIPFKVRFDGAKYDV